MKSGTTTLFDALNDHPDVHLPEKELNFFSSDKCFIQSEFDKYRSQFVAGKINGDCSTAYSMLPNHSGVADRAYKLLDGPIPLIYIIRDPVARSISHHYHLVARGATALDFEDALVEFPEIIHYSQYETQAAPWISLFGPTAVHVTRLEHYRDNPSDCLAAVFRHIGADPERAATAVARHSNQTATAHVYRGVSRRLLASKFSQSIYRNTLRRVLPSRYRNLARKTLLPRPPARPDPPKESSLTQLADTFSATYAFIDRHSSI